MIGAGSPGMLIQKIRKVAVPLERNAIKLVAQAELECQILANFPGILEEEAIFMLHEALVVGRRTLSAGVVELGLGLDTRTRLAEPPPWFARVLIGLHRLRCSSRSESRNCQKR